jgi:hypothetical protein
MKEADDILHSKCQMEDEKLLLFETNNWRKPTFLMENTQK